MWLQAFCCRLGRRLGGVATVLGGVDRSEFPGAGGALTPLPRARGGILAIALALGCNGSSGVAPPATDGGAGAGGGRSFAPDPGCRGDEDCDVPGQACYRFGRGPGTCQAPHEPVSTCAVERESDECCSSDDCAQGECAELVTQPVECSPTAGFDVRNACVQSECETDADCAGGACTPVGYRVERVCIAASCAGDEDCDAEPGGACALLDLGCCGEQVGGAPRRDPQITCVYPSDGCQSDDDCAQGEYCVVSDRAHCATSCG